MGDRPIGGCSFCENLQQNHVLLAPEMPGHAAQGLKEDPLVINAEQTESSPALEQFVKYLMDAGARLSRTRRSSDEPTLAECMAIPGESAKLDYSFLALLPKFESGSYQAYNSECSPSCP